MKGKTFRKYERLKSRKLIKALFSRGKSFGVYPLRLVYMPVREPLLPAPVQFTVSVPKRKFRRASQRNRLRRQVREAWRLHKQELYTAIEGKNITYAFMVLYVAKEPLPYSEVDKSMQKLIERFRRKELRP